MTAAPGAFEVSDFGAFFSELHGHEAFAWQRSLAEQVLSGEGWPEVIDVPTGMGKTAVIDIAVFALASQSHLPPAERTAPTRTFVIVDRRVIVDQAYERACRIAAALHAGVGEVTAAVAARLRAVAGARGEDAEALSAVRMRGGTTWADAWLTSPAQPAVVCGTVDQLGSRLLFRGYGVSTARRPIDAALVGADRLLLLDEAHLASPLIETITSVCDEEDQATQPVLPLRRPRPVLLSATPPGERESRRVLRIDPAAERSEEARRRLSARRLVHLLDVRGTSDRDLVLAMAEAARHALRKEGVSRVLVTANTVSLARAVFGELGDGAVDDESRDVAREGAWERALLIGRCRPFERELIAKQWLLPGARLNAETERVPGELPVIAVATQTVEVGADLDVDALVTECCPFDALLQRLGRLDRRGRIGTSMALVLHQDARHASGSRRGLDHYRDAGARTWAWLVGRTSAPTPTRVSGRSIGEAITAAPCIDLGPTSLAERLDPAARSSLAAKAPLAPVALGPQLAAWARTSPTPAPEQEVGSFLHGLGREAPTVDVCWRALKTERDEAWIDELASAPVAGHEVVTVSLGEAVAFLEGHDVALGADLEGAEAEDLDPFDERLPVVAYVVAPDRSGQERAIRRLERPRSLRPGDTIVLRWDEGGHDKWGWTGRHDGVAVVDVADLDARTGELRRLRLRREALRVTLGVDPGPVPRTDDDGDEVTEFLEELVVLARDSSSLLAGIVDRGVEALLGQLAARRAQLVPVGVGPDSWWMLRSAWRRSRLGEHSLEASKPASASLQAMEQAISDDDSVDAATSTSAATVPLDAHLLDVERRAEELAQLLGLPEPLRLAVGLAGRLHDLGKADPRFQVMLHGGSRLRALSSDRLIAKSGMDPTDRRAFEAARVRSGWPRGMRHEALSSVGLEVLATEQPAVFAGIDVDLVQHLVAAHHGRARPLLPPKVDPEPQHIQVQVPGADGELSFSGKPPLVDWRAPARFERLGARHGWWGLALLETVLRLADHGCSAAYAAALPGTEESVMRGDEPAEVTP